MGVRLLRLLSLRWAPLSVLVATTFAFVLTFTANGVQVTIASTVMLQAQPNKNLNIRLLEGRARITTQAGSQLMKPGNSF